MPRPAPDALPLLPQPKSVTRANGTWPVPKVGYIVLEAHPATRDVFPAERLAATLEELNGSEWRVARGGEPIRPREEIRCHFDAGVEHDQGYRLTIGAAGIDTYARTAAGTFYALQTLAQVFRASSGKRLPCLTITDWPDFPRRGVYHDTARGKVPQLATLLQLVDDLASLKINEFQLYVENNFEFRRHPAMYGDTDPLTAEELLVLDEACRVRHIDFVPSLTSLGHFEKILSRPVYRRLAEAEPDQLKAIGAPCWVDLPWSLCVTDPDAKKLLKDMYDEFAPNFRSERFNICCDEAYDLGRVRSKERADQVGTGQMYVEWIGYCDGLAKGHGKRIQMWGDIILHHPDLIAQLPADATMLEWGYEHDHKFDEHCATFAAAGKPFYVCPGTSSWMTLSSRTKNAFGNIHSAATSGLKHGAVGLLNTDWGDAGHQQMLSVSLLAFAYGAAAGWNIAATPNPHAAGSEAPLKAFLRAASVQVFQDPAGEFATLAYELGLAYDKFGWQRFNASVDHFLFREKFDFANYVNRVTPRDLQRVIGMCEKLMGAFARSEIRHPEADQIVTEFIFTCRELIHVCRRTLVRQRWLAADPARRNPEHEELRAKKPVPLEMKSYRAELKALAKHIQELAGEFETLWLARNKRSRMADVMAEFERIEGEYKTFAKG